MASPLASTKVLLASATSHIDLAIARSMGRAGARVIAAVPPGGALAAGSRYVKGTIPLASDDPRDVVAAVAAALRTGAFTHVITAREDLIVLLNERRAELQRYAEFLFPDPTAFEQCLYKDRTCEIAERVGVPFPRSIVPGPGADLTSLSFPVVVKPRHRDPRGRRARADYVAMYARDYDELLSHLDSIGSAADPPIVQEYCPGEGAGVEVLMRDGEPLAVFQHRRLREKPATGGISVLCESVAADTRLTDWAVSLLKAMNWDGVAMVEFRVDPRTRAARLIEVNGRFWGSLPLALRSGVDFPALYLMSRVSPQDVPRMPHYRIGVRCRSLAHDTAALLDTLRTGNRPRVQAMMNYVAAFSPVIGGYVWSMNDPFPSLLNPWIRLRRRWSGRVTPIAASKLAKR